MKRRMAAAALALALLQACGGGGDGDEAGWHEVAFTRVGSGADFYGTWPVGTAVANTDAEWTAIWAQFQSAQQPKPARPAIDFSTRTLVGASAGWGSSGCHSLRITRVLERATEVRVEFAVTLGPPPGGGCTAVMTPMVDIVTIPKTTKPVTFAQVA